MKLHHLIANIRKKENKKITHHVNMQNFNG